MPHNLPIPSIWGRVRAGQRAWASGPAPSRTSSHDVAFSIYRSPSGKAPYVLRTGSHLRRLPSPICSYLLPFCSYLQLSATYLQIAATIWNLSELMCMHLTTGCRIRKVHTVYYAEVIYKMCKIDTLWTLS